MEAKELMIGNIVCLKDNYITLINANDFKYAEEYGLPCSEPIEITPKILRAIGFEEEDRDFLGYDMGYWYSPSTEKFNVSIRSGLSNTDGRLWNTNVINEIFETVASCDVQYLHQLQNIVTLAGYELKINLESLRSEK